MDCPHLQSGLQPGRLPRTEHLQLRCIHNKQVSALWSRWNALKITDWRLSSGDSKLDSLKLLLFKAGLFQLRGLQLKIASKLAERNSECGTSVKNNLLDSSNSGALPNGFKCIPLTTWRVTHRTWCGRSVTEPFSNRYWTSVAHRHWLSLWKSFRSNDFASFHGKSSEFFQKKKFLAFFIEKMSLAKWFQQNRSRFGLLDHWCPERLFFEEKTILANSKFAIWLTISLNWREFLSNFDEYTRECRGPAANSRCFWLIKSHGMLWSCNWPVCVQLCCRPDGSGLRPHCESHVI